MNDSLSTEVTLLSDFKRLKKIGSGNYGDVFQVCNKKNGQFFAMKIVEKPENIVRRMRLNREKKILETVKSPFICEMFHSFETDHKFYFVLELLNGGEMYTFLDRNSPLKQDAKKFYFGEMALGLEYLHNNNILYRDMKMENTLLDKNGHVKLTDFGLSKYNFRIGDKATTYCGTLWYLAPELIKEMKYDYGVDIWAFGIMMYLITCQQLPFSVDNADTYRRNIACRSIELPNHMPSDEKELLEGMLMHDPIQRFTIQKAKESSFFQSVDWEKMAALGYEPPFKPNLSGDDDVSLFRTKHTEMPVKDSQYEEQNVCLLEIDSITANDPSVMETVDGN